MILVAEPVNGALAGQVAPLQLRFNEFDPIEALKPIRVVRREHRRIIVCPDPPEQLKFFGNGWDEYGPPERESRSRFTTILRKRAHVPNISAYAYVTDEELSLHSIFMHQWVLEDSLGALRSSTGGEDPLGIIEWMYSPDFLDWTEVRPGNRVVFVRKHQRDIPFSFYNCCLAFPYEPDNVRFEFIKELPTFQWFNNLSVGVRNGLYAYLRDFFKEDDL